MHGSDLISCLNFVHKCCVVFCLGFVLLSVTYISVFIFVSFAIDLVVVNSPKSNIKWSEKMFSVYVTSNQGKWVDDVDVHSVFKYKYVAAKPNAVGSYCLKSQL